MFKTFGYGDELRKDILNGYNNTIKLLNKEDYRTPWDINRPIEELFEGVESLYEFLDMFGQHYLTDEGVFSNSLRHEFDIKSGFTKKITLFDKRDISNITSINKVYSRIAPGIAGVDHNTDSRQKSIIVVHKPNTRVAEKQIAYILKLFVDNEEEGVWINYDTIADVYSAKIIKKEVPIGNVKTYNFSGDTAIELLTSIYNELDFNPFFVETLGTDIEKILLEPMFEITTTGTYFWNIVEGNVILQDTNTGFYLGEFTISDLFNVVIENISTEHRRYGKNVRLDIYGTDENSREVNTNGGIQYNIAKGFRLENSAGALIHMDIDGNIIINSAPNKNIDFGGVDVLGISANTINLTSDVNIDGNFDVDAGETGQVYSINADIKTEIINELTETVTTENTTKGSLTENITTENRTTENKTEVITGISTETINELVETITTENRTIETKTETITGTSTETASGKKIVNAETELELNTPIKTETIGSETKTVSGTSIETITGNKSIISSAETKFETLTMTKKVNGNETETITGTSTEIVTGDKSSKAQNQNIEGVEDVLIKAPNITLDAGETGIVNIIGQQQIIEGDTVRLEDNIIELNKNQTGTPASGLTSGFEVNRGTSTKASVLFREIDNTWGIGTGVDIKTITRKEDKASSIDNGIPSYDSTNDLIKTDTKFLHNRTTGVTTINVSNAATVAPIITNSTKMIDNLNADMVDGCDVVTSISGESNLLIPTEKAVCDWTDDKFVKNNSLAITNITKGVKITYTNGDSVSKTININNIDVDTVDGVHIDNTGVITDEICTWSGTTGLKTSNKKIITSISGESDAEVPTEKAVVDYFNNRVRFGTGTFNSSIGETIDHNLGSTPTAVQVTAHSNPSGYLGEVWATWDATNITVYCSGSTTSATFSWTAFL